MSAGRGFERGADSISNSIMQGIGLHLQQKRYDQMNERYNKMMDFNLEWQRGMQGLPPSYTDEEEAADLASTRPEIPSSTPTSTPGPLGVPTTQFDTGRPVQPAPARPSGGAAGLLSAAEMRPPRMMPGMSPRGMGMGRVNFGRR